MTQQNEKWIEYAMRISGALGELFSEDSDHYLGEDFFDKADTAAFFHALLTVAPQHMFKKLAKDYEDSDHLALNQLATRLIFQFSNSKNEE